MTDTITDGYLSMLQHNLTSDNYSPQIIERIIAALRAAREPVGEVEEQFLEQCYFAAHKADPNWGAVSTKMIKAAIECYVSNARTQSHDKLRQAEARMVVLEQGLENIREIWAGAECGDPVYAQEAYAIHLCKQMYQEAVNHLATNPAPAQPLAGEERNKLTEKIMRSAVTVPAAARPALRRILDHAFDIIEQHYTLRRRS